VSGSRREALAALFGAAVASAADERGTSRRIPSMQAVPQPYDQVSFQRDEQEVARFHYGAALNRPFVYPVIGPSGRTLTRMGHPGDPYTHSHHNSIWVSYSSVNGIDFWSDHRTDRGRIAVREVVELEDGEERAGVLTKGVWVEATGRELLREYRETWVYRRPNRELLLIFDLTFHAAAADVTFDKAGFGPVGVRVAKWMAVHFGDGRILNSEGGQGEPGTFRKPARWMDYSGSVAEGVREGLTLLDHPKNAGHPSPFHVREDGWMGAMLSTEKAVTIVRGTPLHLRYGVYAHGGSARPEHLDRHWDDFAKLDLHPPFGPPQTERECLHGGHRKFNKPQSFSTTQQCLDYVRKGR
jgi:hypothetical protein